jgi:hypothetical protein
VIRWIGRVLRFGDHAAIWRAALPGRPATGPRWFLARFLDASAVAVRHWGPRWAVERRLLGREVGTWLLALAWLGLPSAALVRAAWRLLH